MLFRSARARETTTKRFGVLLVEENLLSPGEVYAAIREQIEGIVWSLFYWQQGQVTYSAGEFREDDMVQIQLSLREVIFEGIKRAPDARQLLARLGGRDTVLETAGLVVERIEPSWQTQLLSILTNPNVAFILLMVGVYGLIFEFSNPGSIGPGVIGVICLLLGLGNRVRG